MFGLWGKKKPKKESDKVQEMLGKVSVRTALKEYKDGEISRNELKQIVGVNDDKELLYLLQSCGFISTKKIAELSKVERVCNAERKGAEKNNTATLNAKKTPKGELKMSDEQAANLAKAISAVLSKDEKR